MIIFILLFWLVEDFKALNDTRTQVYSVKCYNGTIQEFNSSDDILCGGRVSNPLKHTEGVNLNNAFSDN